MGKLDGKVALVTGGNKGIGKGIARGLAAEGASLALVARGAAELRRTADELAAGGARVLALPADVTDERQVQQVFARPWSTSAGSTSWSTTPAPSRGARSTSCRPRRGTGCWRSTCARPSSAPARRCAS